ncbi:MAG TPA: zinc ribbon domain-containing protein [Solirubrobacteraceae bacterium]|jgi:putative FmdB family regulatory protein|nr:zinc ribbon domain-containing protein [Solirubrobacteraceae bacterium]
MPLYDFHCLACDCRFEAQVPYGELPSCPECGAARTEKLLAPFAGPFTVGVRGYAAKKSDATRAAREEQRAERKAERIERRKHDGA